ncbi:MAG TPA: SCP2 sterol-binding domain-containing protein [Pseudonocardiaceae bacterium]|jgi:putative sterol carrier protein|nr:SCP2 sterol-binding domain-containing protein [Pseudonocardiaceae bacterium]
MTASDSTTAFHEIKTNIAGRDDGDIMAYVNGREGGVEAILDLVFSQLPGAFLPDKAKRQEISFQYEINTDDGPRYYYADVRDGTCTTGSGRMDSPRVTMIMDIPIFLQVLTGTMAPVRAFLTRKIKVVGDMMAATKFESWFARP